MLTAGPIRGVLTRPGASSRSLLQRYSLAAVNTGLAVLMLWPFHPLLQSGFSPPLLLAVAVSALLGGVGPGLLAVLLTAIIANYWFYPPFGHFAIASTQDVARQLLFLACAVPLALLGGAVRHARARAEEEEAALRESEARLRASEERYRTLIDAAAQVVWSWDPSSQTGDFGAAQRWWEEVTGQRVGEQTGPNGEGWLESLHPDDREHTRQAWQAMARGARYDIEYRLRERGGTYRYVSARAVPIHGADGEVREFIGMLIDTTAQHRTETALRASEARLRRVLESGMIGIAFWDGERVTEANDTFLQLLGYDRADIAAGLLRHGNLTPPEYEAVDRRATEEVTTRGACTPYEKEFFRKDGSRVPVLAGGALLSGAGDRRDGVFFILDLTERRQAEEQLQAAQRLETVGRLAGGIAHEANNQMSVVLGAVHFLLQRTELSADVRQDLEHIRKAAEHTAAITRQLLAFSRRQILQPRPLDLNVEIQSLEPVLRRTLGPQTALVLRLAPGLGLVRADPGQLSQVLLNLILNARDAMPDGGTLTIETTGTTFGNDAAPSVPGDGTFAGPYAVLTVSDTGHGMDRETLSRVFEPFFTTKPVGEGTGLGLSTVHGIVRQSSGYIAVDSAPGRGATFRIYLPQTAPSVELSTPAATAFGLHSNSTILVVDDQPQVRAMLVRALQEDGYTVFEASTASEALAVVARDDVRLDLVVTDLTMPEMSGGELAKQLTRLSPSLSVLFTSGYADEEIRRRGWLNAEQPFLQKPYSPDVFTAHVRQLLEKNKQQ